MTSATTLMKTFDANNNTKSTNSYGTYRVSQKQRQALPIYLKSSASPAKSEVNSAISELNAKTVSNGNLNNNNLNKSTKHGQVAIGNARHKSIIAVVPEPCRTCGRPDQPERLHSHPATPIRDLTAVAVSKKMEIVPKLPGELINIEPIFSFKLFVIFHSLYYEDKSIRA